MGYGQHEGCGGAKGDEEETDGEKGVVNQG